MHPLSLFPHLFSYPFLAYFLLRISVAWIIISVALSRFRKVYKGLAILEGLAGLLILVGLYTQGALIAGIIFLIAEIFLDRATLSSNQKKLYYLTLIVAFSLLFLGPGSFAFDLPL